MATCLSTLVSLKKLCLEFGYSSLSPLRNLHPAASTTYSVLPALTIFYFRGFSEYLEDLVALIDVPQLYYFSITFINQRMIDPPQLDTPQLALFLGRTTRFKAKATDTAGVAFDNFSPRVSLISRTFQRTWFKVMILRAESRADRQLSSLTQVCSSSLPTISTLENLYIYNDSISPLTWRGDLENMLWLRLLHPFNYVKNLYLAEEIVPRIAPVLRELVRSGMTEVFPAL